jgi:hypothetical protein
VRAFESEHEGRKIEVNRFKGLGEMDWHELRETTMDLRRRATSCGSTWRTRRSRRHLLAPDGRRRRLAQDVHPGERQGRAPSSTRDRARRHDGRNDMPDDGVQETLENANIEMVEIQEEMERSFLD